MSAYLKLLRLEESYKNLTVIVGIIAAMVLFPISINFNLTLRIIGLILLAVLLSSANYLLNAITDRNYDVLHPSKKFRPLPTKQVSVPEALIFMLFIILVTGILSFIFFRKEVIFSLFSLFLAAVLYNLPPIRLKDIPFIDVVSESINNPLRFLIGWFLIAPTFPKISWLLLIWSLAGFLMTHKRLQELKEYNEKAILYRTVFKYYSPARLKRAEIMYLFLSLGLAVLIIF